jgi:hypothetical protein
MKKTKNYLRWERREDISPAGDDLLALQMLHAYGLVEEELDSSIDQPYLSSISSQGQAEEALRQLIKNIQNAIVKRSFRISRLGDDFLRLMGLENNTETASTGK